METKNKEIHRTLEIKNMYELIALKIALNCSLNTIEEILVQNGKIVTKYYDDLIQMYNSTKSLKVRLKIE